MTDLDSILKTYGDLLYDLCDSVLRGPTEARAVFRSIISDVRSTRPKDRYVDHQRAWLLALTYRKLLENIHDHAQKPTPVEQIQLDASPASQRLKKFDSYFRRLDAEDQLLLLMRDKYGIPFPEIATAMGTPEGSLKSRRQQALRALEDWLWETS